MSNKLMTLDELFEKHASLAPGEVILDVRRAEEFAEGHIKGALNVSHEEVLAHAQELKKYQTIYIHCKRGGRARTALQSLEQAGFMNLVCVHDAGMDAWMERGYPVAK